MKKKLFMISVIDTEGSLNRFYADTVKWLFNNHTDFSDEYETELHNGTHSMDLYKSLDEAIQTEKYEGYVVLLDCLDTSRGLFNPNVMFEFGGVKNLNKPFVVMAINSEASKFPFDVKNINIGFIPETIKGYIEEAYNGVAEKDVRKWYNSLTSQKRTEILDFFSNEYKKYQDIKYKLGEKEALKENLNTLILELTSSHQELKNEIRKITNYVSNTAEYIDGEAAAFLSLSEAVDKAKYSLRTSRFANQSIVVEPTREQQAFMDALYKASHKLNSKAVRIICNNNPVKWHDIYNILFFGGNESRVYVRKADFSIHFEMVVIDESIAFIHFYQQVHANTGGRMPNNQQIEKLNSTLKIQGSSICQKFAKIYDRLHHRDVEDGTLHDPSRTLLGIDIDKFDGEVEGKIEELGYFELGANGSGTATKHIRIMSMFKNAFQNWDLGTRDRINMASGIALLDGNSQFIEEMFDKKILTEEEKESAIKLFEKNQ